MTKTESAVCGMCNMGSDLLPATSDSEGGENRKI